MPRGALCSCLLVGCGLAACAPTGSAAPDEDLVSLHGDTSSSTTTGSSGEQGGGVDFGTSSGSGGAGGGCGPVNDVCLTDQECSDGDPCTEDTCSADGEFSECAHADIPQCSGDPTAPIDSSCDDGAQAAAAVWVPYSPLVTPNLPADCNGGFEWQSGLAKGCTTTYSMTSGGPCGSEARTLYVDIATYTAGDWLRITAVGADDKPYLLLDTCRIRTADYVDPTNGNTRPPDDSIRQFEIQVKAGTKSLTFDSTNAFTPWYMRVLGVCDFAPLPDPGTCAWRPASL